MRDEINVCTLTDSYKFTHHKMYLPGTEVVHSYYESRAGAKYDETVFFGLRFLLMKYFEGEVVTREKIEQAAQLSEAHFGTDKYFNRVMWERILNHYGGYLPVVIRAVDEGTVVPVANVMLTVENTDPECAGLTNHMETVLSHLWYSCTVATLSREVKKMLTHHMEVTTGIENHPAVPFMLHDFGGRGATGTEAAGIGGAAHLVNFRGSDTIRAMEVIRDYYGCSMAGCSVAATEHSVMTADGPEGEEGVVEHLLNEFPTGILSVVGDSYDIYNFCENIAGGTFKDRILERDGTFVIRPDSGDPVTVLLKCLDILYVKFGGYKNDKGFWVLNDKVRLLWGDGLTPDKINNICQALSTEGWSIENIATFGMGGGLLQRVHRDIQRFAFKCSAQRRNGKWRDVYKDPVEGAKPSKKGCLALMRDQYGVFSTVRVDPDKQDVGELNIVFNMGYVVNHVSFDEIRERAAI